MTTHTHRASVKNPIELTGIAVHSGHEVKLRLVPQPSGTGIFFVRTDLQTQVKVDAVYSNVVDTRLRTTIGNKTGAKFSTIEHLMAALAGCGIDDVKVEVDGAEIPVMDGSSKVFVEAIEKAGIVQNGMLREYIYILKPVEVKEGDAWARLVPSEQFEMNVEIDFDDRVIGKQSFCTSDEGNKGDISFAKNFASARTFGFVGDLEKLNQIGFAQGSSLDNTIAIQNDEILNEKGLQFDNEFARHKALDALGDLALAGTPIIGRFESYKSGHGLNNKLLHALFADNSCYNTRHAT